MELIWNLFDLQGIPYKLLIEFKKHFNTSILEYDINKFLNNMSIYYL